MNQREQFEKIEKIEKILNRNKHFIFFSEKLGLYVCDLQLFKDDVMWLNGAWFLFRELNK